MKMVSKQELIDDIKNFLDNKETIIKLIGQDISA